MREFVYFFAGLGISAVLTALAVILEPKSAVWFWLLWGGATVFILCTIYPLYLFALRVLRSRPERDGLGSKENWRPIYLAVQHVAKVMDDNDEKRCWPTARHAIRQAALHKEIRIRGRQSAGLMGKGGYSKVETEIPITYWEKADVGPIATSKDMASSDDCHTFPQQFSTGLYGEELILYAGLKVNWVEVTKKWPLP